MLTATTGMNKIRSALFILSVSLAAYACNNGNKNQSEKKSDSTAIKSANSSTDTTGNTDTSKHKHDILETVHSGGSAAYSITTPAGWKRQADTIIQGGGRFIKDVAPLDDASDKFPENITVITEKLLEPGLDNYVKKGKEGMQKNVPSLIFLGEGDATVDGIPAKWIRLTFLGNKVPYQLLMCLVAKGETGFVITCTSDETHFKKYERTFKEAISSFKFTK